MRRFPIPNQAAFNFMQEKPALADRRHTRKDFVYFALKPPKDLWEMLHEQARAALRPLRDARLMTADRFHISLLGTGEHNGLRQPFIDRLSGFAATVTAPPAPVCFDRVGRFGGNAIVFYNGDTRSPIQGLYEKLRDAARREPLVGLHSPRTIAPHMTICRTEAAFDTAPIDPIRWLATEFVLVHSHDSRHDILGRWPLTGAPFKRAAAGSPDDLFDKAAGQQDQPR